MKVLVFGAGGQIGREVCRAAWPPRYAIMPLDEDAVEITKSAAVTADAGTGDTGSGDQSRRLHGRRPSRKPLGPSTVRGQRRLRPRVTTARHRSFICRPTTCSTGAKQKPIWRTMRLARSMSTGAVRKPANAQCERLWCGT